MSVFLINSYDINDPEEFKKYGPAALPLIHRHGGEVLASDVQGEAVEGKPRTMNAIIRFPSREAVWQCYHDPDYEAVKQIRHRSTSNTTMVIVKPFAIK
jgi:uncharacterized protein (DUF1330 family)